MLRSMYSGVSGLKANQQKMDVVGNNISNSNTSGFKKGRVTFQEMMNQNLRAASAPQGGRGGINPQSVGLGVDVGSIDTDQTQGNMESTGSKTDLAIEGDGFFMARDGQQQLYTRDGGMDIDANGDLVNANTGNKIQGWEAENGSVSASGDPDDLRIPVGETMDAQKTSEVEFGGNLDSRAANGVHRSGSVDVIDSAGESHTTQLDFVRQIGSNLTTEDVDVNGEDISFEQSVYDPELENTDITFNQEDDSELDVEYDGDLTITADFENQTPTRGEIETAVNKVLDEEGFTGPLQFNTTDDNDLSTVAGDLDGNTLTLNYPEFGDNTVNVMQDKENYDQDLNNLQVDFTQTGDEPSASYSNDNHQLTVEGDFEDDLENVVTEMNNTLADSGFDGELLIEGDTSTIGNGDQQSFDLTAGNRWDWNLAEIDGVIEDSASGNGTLVFDSNGRISEGQTGQIEFNPVEPGAPEQNIDLDFAGATQQAAEFTIDGESADGYSNGDLETFSVDGQGKINGEYTNGQNQVLGQVAVADFNNPGGLEKEGETMFAQTPNSGTPRAGEAGQDGRGSIASGTLEMSNVDLSDEFSEMITTQRGYQANSSLITTSDEMLQELVNLKR
ncbi:MAG: flagellar hook protein FlgE [Halanaerobiaceae bacterium]